MLTSHIKKTAKDNEGDFSPEVIETVEHNFYVDDCLKSVREEEEGGASQLEKGHRISTQIRKSFNCEEP